MVYGYVRPPCYVTLAGWSIPSSTFRWTAVLRVACKANSEANDEKATKVMVVLPILAKTRACCLWSYALLVCTKHAVLESVLIQHRGAHGKSRVSFIFHSSRPRQVLRQHVLIPKSACRSEKISVHGGSTKTECGNGRQKMRKIVGRSCGH